MITSRHFSSHVKDAKSRERREIRREAATALGRFSNLFQEDQIRRAVTFRILIKTAEGNLTEDGNPVCRTRQKKVAAKHVLFTRNTSCLYDFTVRIRTFFYSTFEQYRVNTDNRDNVLLTTTVI